MINSRTIWTAAVGLSVVAHLVIFTLFYQSGSSHGDDGYLEVELSLEEPKKDQRTQTKQALPAPSTVELMPTMPELTDVFPPDLDLSPSMDIPPQDIPQLPIISVEFENLTDSFDTFGDSNSIFFGTNATDESASRRGTESLEQNYLKRVSARIHRFKQYPREARIAKQEGTVIIKLTLNADGSVQDKKITSSSGIDLLDDEALQIMARAEPLPKFPSALVKKIGPQLKFSTSINFKLSDSE